MNASIWPHLFQWSFAASLAYAIFIVLKHVRKTTVSDKYGVGWVVFLSVFSCLNILNNIFSLISSEAGAVILLAAIGFISLGISFSVRVTEYSRVRRAAIQKVALLHFSYQELFKSNDAANNSRTITSDGVEALWK